MKYLFVLLCSLLIQMNLLAQDLVIKKNGDELSCKIQEVGIDKILYTVKNNKDTLQMDTLSISKAEVLMIKYQNGSKDVFSTEQSVDYASTPQSKNENWDDKIEVEGRRFFYHRKKIGKSRLISLLRHENNKEINMLVTRSIVSSIAAPVLKYASIPFGVIGFFILGIQAADGNNDSQSKVAGVSMVSGFFLAQIGGYTVEYFQYKHIKEAVKLYNAAH